MLSGQGRDAPVHSRPFTQASQQQTDSNATAQQLQFISHYNPKNAFLLQAYSTVTSPQESFHTRHLVIMIHVVFFDIIIATVHAATGSNVI